MLPLIVVVLGFVIKGLCLKDLHFPPGFMFGAASSSYQIEGAWNVSDKAEGIWDRFTRVHKDRILDGSNGDVACDSYHLWERDIEMAAELGLHFYRFSISWSRLLPNGFSNYISEDGKKYYNNLIDGLLERGIKPFVSLYHQDMPQKLQDLGGWANPYSSDWFAEYARIAFKLYGDRVKTWITVNEPFIICEAAYGMGFTAPGVIDPEVGVFLCNKHTLLAHAKAYRIYDAEFRHIYNGELSVSNQPFWYFPYSEEDANITELVLEYTNGRYTHPIYSKEGGFPPGILQVLKESSEKQGYQRSNLPQLTKNEIELIKGTYDFFAVNYYTSRLVRKAEPGENLGPWPMQDAPVLNAKLIMDPKWKLGESYWFAVYPEGLRRQLQWLSNKYGALKFIVTENGYPDKPGFNDINRIMYYKQHLEQILLAIKEDGINVTGYTAWTMMDNFEWSEGYQAKFGLYDVDFSSPKRTRTPKASAHYYSSIIRAHSLDVPIPSKAAFKSSVSPVNNMQTVLIILSCFILSTSFNSLSVI